MWDQGVVTECVGYIASESTCAQVINHPCTLVILPGTAGMGCGGAGGAAGNGGAGGG